MNRTWNTLFESDLDKEGSILAHYTGNLVQNWAFVAKIKQYLSPPPHKKPFRILEAGAGTGYLATYLSSLGHEVSVIDIDTDFIEKVNSFFKTKISIVRLDIRINEINFPKFDLVYNIGVMEHFSDEDIISISKNFRAISDLFVFAVPNFKIPFSYGDERYLSKRHWQKLLKKAGWEIKETFSYNRYRLRKYLTGFVCKHANQSS